MKPELYSIEFGATNCQIKRSFNGIRSWEVDSKFGERISWFNGKEMWTILG